MKWEDIEVESMGPGLSRRAIHGHNITIARIYLDAGAIVHEHSHANEQISQVLAGRLIFEVGGETREATQGDVFIIPPGVPHRVTASEKSIVLDTFSPPRNDWMEGKDDYFRS